MCDATDALVTACQALTEAIRTSVLDPADAVQMLSAFIAVAPIAGSSDPDTLVAQLATASMMRRCALASLARACADYNPASSTEAITLRTQVVALFGSEAVTAADASERDVYRTLRALRSAVSADLNARAATLLALVSVTTRTFQGTSIGSRLRQLERRKITNRGALAAEANGMVLEALEPLMT